MLASLSAAKIAAASGPSPTACERSAAFRREKDAIDSSSVSRATSPATCGPKRSSIASGPRPPSSTTSCRRAAATTCSG